MTRIVDEKTRARWHGEFQGAVPEELSGGMRKGLRLARALGSIRIASTWTSPRPVSTPSLLGGSDELIISKRDNEVNPVPTPTKWTAAF